MREKKRPQSRGLKYVNTSQKSISALSSRKSIARDLQSQPSVSPKLHFWAMLCEFIVQKARMSKQKRNGKNQLKNNSYFIISLPLGLPLCGGAINAGVQVSVGLASWQISAVLWWWFFPSFRKP